MKNLLYLAFVMILSSCAVIGTDLIHSPSSSGGTTSTHRHIHGGATKNAPPDAIHFSIDDSTNLSLSAKAISEKLRFGGILFPIFPIFWMPKKDLYAKHPNSLIIEIWFNTEDIETSFEIVSANVVANERTYNFEENVIASWRREITFPLSAKETSSFELTNFVVKIDDTYEEFPVILFEQKKQPWRFLGP